jgi:drug/metabolite transporter (DMT)-like permease
VSVRTHLLPAIMLVLGVAIVVRTASEGGGAGYLIGALLAVAGGLRLWAESRVS